VVPYDFRNKKGSQSTALGFEMDMRPLRTILLKLLNLSLKLTPIPAEFDTSAESHPGGGFREEFTNFHVDWVGIIWKDPSTGFAVQTLMRHRRDCASLRSLDLINNSWLPEAVKEKMREGEEAALEDLFNKFHFLAGRRSWVILPAEDSRAKSYVTDTAGV
jgi:hypothetical protein